MYKNDQYEHYLHNSRFCDSSGVKILLVCTTAISRGGRKSVSVKKFRKVRFFDVGTNNHMKSMADL
jgi:hypothetical protein